jgi:D-tyrosyl-tRNA(Tyr) deacylase
LKGLVQRVSKASVSVGGQLVDSIDRGLVVLLGVASDDSEKDAVYLADKVLNLRIFSDEAGKFNLSLRHCEGELLIISQFTLLADTHKGRRPNFIAAAPPDDAEALFERFVQLVRASGLKAATGVFGGHMLVEIHNEGPVTIMLDSREHISARA